MHWGRHACTTSVVPVGGHLRQRAGMRRTGASGRVDGHDQSAGSADGRVGLADRLPGSRNIKEKAASAGIRVARIWQPLARQVERADCTLPCNEQQYQMPGGSIELFGRFPHSERPGGSSAEAAGKADAWRTGLRAGEALSRCLLHVPERMTGGPLPLNLERTSQVCLFYPETLRMIPGIDGRGTPSPNASSEPMLCESWVEFDYRCLLNKYKSFRF